MQKFDVKKNTTVFGMCFFQNINPYMTRPIIFFALTYCISVMDPKTHKKHKTFDFLLTSITQTCSMKHFTTWKYKNKFQMGTYKGRIVMSTNFIHLFSTKSRGSHGGVLFLHIYTFAHTRQEKQIKIDLFLRYIVADLHLVATPVHCIWRTSSDVIARKNTDKKIHM